MDNNAALPVKRKPGRPKGSHNKTITKRPDSSGQALPGSGDNSLIMKYSRVLYGLPKIDINNLDQVNNRIDLFFSLCEEYDIKPSVAGLALAFGINRGTLFNWLARKTAAIKSQECFDSLKAAYDLINMQYEFYMNTGKINPVAGIFLLKNNYGYQDTTTHVIQTSDNADPSTDDITDKAGLLE